jgi:hypothetical protein
MKYFLDIIQQLLYIFNEPITKEDHHEKINCRNRFIDYWKCMSHICFRRRKHPRKERLQQGAGSGAEVTNLSIKNICFASMQDNLPSRLRPCGNRRKVGCNRKVNLFSLFISRVTNSPVLTGGAILILILLLTGSVGAVEDKTPYHFIFGGNSYYGARNVTVTWLAERFDMGIGGLADWDYLFDSIYDTCLKAPAKMFLCGPYASTQELNMYRAGQPGLSYEERFDDADDSMSLWVYGYAGAYMDSVGVTRESLVVHYDEDSVWVNQDGDGGRLCSLYSYAAGAPQRRFTYQYWNNLAGDTLYPAGYVWLANGFSNTTKAAIAYAFRRFMYEDTVKSGWGYPTNHRWTIAFSDNQYRDGGGGDSAAPRLYSYYDNPNPAEGFIPYGGPSAHLDWEEISSLYTANLQFYYDSSTLAIDSAVDNVLDSVGQAEGMDTLDIQGGKYFIRLSNVDKANAFHFGHSIKLTSAVLENPLDYAKAWGTYQNLIAISDTMAGRNNGDSEQRFLAWMFLGDFMVDEGTWRTGDRMYYAHHAFFMNVYESNIFYGPFRFNDSTRWREIYEVDLGDPVAPRDTVSKTGSGGTAIHVLKRKYLNGTDTAIVLMRSAHGTAGYTTDSIQVALDGNYYQVDVDGDTAISTDDTIWLKPYQGWIGVQGQASEQAPTITNILPISAYKDSTDDVSCIMEDDYGINETWSFVIKPDSTQDTINTTTHDPIVTYLVYSNSYTWTDSGQYRIVFVCTDTNSHETRDSLQILVDVYHDPPQISNIASSVDYTDSQTTITADIVDTTTGGGTQYVYCWVINPSSDSVHVDGDTLSPIDADYNMIYNYTWPSTAGTYWIHVKAIDTEPSSSEDSGQVVVTVAGTPQDSVVFDSSTGLIDTYGHSSNPDVNYGDLTAFYVGASNHHAWMADYSMDDVLSDSDDMDSINVWIQVSGMVNYFDTDTGLFYLCGVPKTSEWLELQATWADRKTDSSWGNAGGDTVTNGCISDTIITYPGSHVGGDWFTFKIHRNTLYGGDWLDSVKLVNSSFAIVCEAAGGMAGYEYMILKSSENGTEANRPYMVVYASSPVAEVGPDKIQKINLRGVTIGIKD